MILAALLLQAAAAPAVTFEPVTADDAIAYFRRMCVGTMPDPGAFAVALNAESAGWREYRKQNRGTPVIGHFWRSGRGELSYLYLPGATFNERTPACHYTFRTGADFRHDMAAAALAGALRLDSGKPTGSRKAPQTRWETVLPNGTRARIFLSSSVRDMDGPASTLSVSAYRATGRE